MTQFPADLETHVDQAFKALKTEDKDTFNREAQIVRDEMQWSWLETVAFFSGVRVVIENEDA